MRNCRFENVDTTIPIIKYKLNGEVCYAVVDSGSEQTVFDSSFVKSHNEQFQLSTDGDNMISFSGVSPHPTDVACQYASTTIDLGRGKTICVEGMLMSLAHLSDHFDNYGIHLSLLLGADILSDNDAAIDFVKRKVIFR